MADADNLLDRVKDELGEPYATYGLGAGRFRAKLAVGLGLVVGGVALAVGLFWSGLAQFIGFFAKLLFLIPMSGVLLLWNLYKTRGLHVLLYPSGLLRLQRGEVESFPWGEIETLRLKADQGSIEIVRDESGAAVECWVAVQTPLVQFWKAGLTVGRADATSAKFTPAVAGYADLVEQVQRATLPDLLARAAAQYRAGVAVAFGPLLLTWGGLGVSGKMLPWADLAEVAVAGKHLTVKRKGKWLAWATHDLEQVPNPHVFLALVDLARRSAVPVARPVGGEDQT